MPNVFDTLDDGESLLIDDYGRRARGFVDNSRSARNRRNVLRLANFFLAYCAHHLYHYHVLGRARGCAFGKDQCESGAHAEPPTLWAFVDRRYLEL